MTVLVVSAAVVEAVGEGTVEGLVSGDMAPTAVQCWVCGGGVRVAGGRPDSVSLSVLEVGPMRMITLFSHVGCGSSRLVSYDEVEASPASHIPSPVETEGSKVLVGSLTDEPEPALMSPRCPMCGELPFAVLGGGSQAFCGNEQCRCGTWNALLTAEELANAEVGTIDMSGLGGLMFEGDQ